MKDRDSLNDKIVIENLLTREDQLWHARYHGGDLTACIGRQCSFLISEDIRESVKKVMR